MGNNNNYFFLYIYIYKYYYIEKIIMYFKKTGKTEEEIIEHQKNLGEKHKFSMQKQYINKKKRIIDAELAIFKLKFPEINIDLDLVFTKTLKQLKIYLYDLIVSTSK